MDIDDYIPSLDKDYRWLLDLGPEGVDIYMAEGDDAILVGTLVNFEAQYYCADGFFHTHVFDAPGGVVEDLTQMFEFVKEKALELDPFNRREELVNPIITDLVGEDYSPELLKDLHGFYW